MVSFRQGGRSSSNVVRRSGAVRTVVVVTACLALFRWDVSSGNFAAAQHRVKLVRSTQSCPADRSSLSLSRTCATGQKVTHTANRSLWFVFRWFVAVVGVLVLFVSLLGLTSRVESFSHTLSLMNPDTVSGACVAGLASGGLHTLAGPDHLAGLAPLVTQRRSPLASFGLGVLWGSGHATGQTLLGLACVFVRFGFARASWAQALSQASGYLVGGSLIAIGLLGFYELRTQDDVPETTRFGWATYITGVIHGLQLDTLMFLAPVLALPKFVCIAYITAFGTGTLLSMGACTFALGTVCYKSSQLKRISGAAASVAILLGTATVMSCLGVTLPSF